MAEADTNTEVQTPDPAAIEAEASRAGWVPKEKFHGKDTDWVDAQTYVERGRQILPILRANNRKLEGENQALTTRLTAAELAISESKETIEALKELTDTVAAKAAKDAREELKRQIAKAREDGNVDTELELTSQLTAHVAGEKEAAKAKEPEPKKQEPAPIFDAMKNPVFRAFADSNPWFQDNRRMRAVAVDIAAEMAAAGQFEGVSPADRLAMVGEATLKEFGQTPLRSTRVGGGSNGAGGDRGGGEQTYETLPAEAKAQCTKDAKKFVGPNRAYKTEAEWRAKFTKLYFTNWGGANQP